MVFSTALRSTAIAAVRSGLASTSLARPTHILSRVAIPSTLALSRSLHASPNRFATPSPASTPSASTSNANVGPATRVKNKTLPVVPNTLPYLFAFVAAAIGSWGAFTIYATNKEKLSSSIFKSVVGQVKNSSEVQQLLSSSAGGANGARLVPVLKRETWLGGMCRVKGSVNMMQGRVDLSFKITTPETTGAPEVGTVYFTSIRAHKHAPFEILRFVVVNDRTGESVSLLEGGQLSSIDVDSGDIV